MDKEPLRRLVTDWQASDDLGEYVLDVRLDEVVTGTLGRFGGGASVGLAEFLAGELNGVVAQNFGLDVLSQARRAAAAMQIVKAELDALPGFSDPYQRLGVRQGIKAVYGDEGYRHWDEYDVDLIRTSATKTLVISTDRRSCRILDTSGGEKPAEFELPAPIGDGAIAWRDHFFVLLGKFGFIVFDGDGKTVDSHENYPLFTTGVGLGCTTLRLWRDDICFELFSLTPRHQLRYRIGKGITGKRREK